jgi:D-glycero-D-manno-heptose 1,7-bisphosphate phosphatase
MGRSTQCVILAGGLGTRLGALAAGKVKPLVEVGGQPFLRILVRRAASLGFRRILLLAGYKADQIAAFAREAEREWADVQVEVSIEPEPLGTAGAIAHACEKLEDSFILLNGDSFFDFDWTDLISMGHDWRDAEIILALRFEPDTSRYGVVEMEENRVAGFRERGTGEGGLINGGVYFFRRSAVSTLPARGSLERETLPKLALAKKLAGKIYGGDFIDIGTPGSLAIAQERFKARE